jgi:carbon starvation protein
MEIAQAFIALVAVSFALTSLDSGTRLLRYNIEEIASSVGVNWIGRYSASLLAVTFIGVFAFYEIDGQPAGLALWGLFGSTNQILGALTLLTIAIYLKQRGRNFWPYFIPMVFMMVVTLTAMVSDLTKYWSEGNILLTSIAASIFTMTLWLIVEAYLRLRRDESQPATGD